MGVPVVSRRCESMGKVACAKMLIGNMCLVFVEGCSGAARGWCALVLRCCRDGGPCLGFWAK